MAMKTQNSKQDQFFMSALRNGSADFDAIDRMLKQTEPSMIAYREILSDNRLHETRTQDIGKLDWHPIRALTLCYLLDSRVCDLQLESNYIFQDLVNHRREKLSEYIRFDRYTDYKPFFGGLLKDSFTLLGAVLNGIEQNDEYCRQLMIAIVKAYFRKQYKDVKKLKVLTEDSLELISEVHINLDTLNFIQCRPLAFILFCSKVFGYTLSKDILPIYAFIGVVRENYVSLLA